MNAAKLIWNSNRWEFTTGEEKENGVQVKAKDFEYIYGLEEWLFNVKLKTLKIGYLDCYRNLKSDYRDIVDVALFARNPIDKNVYHIGNLFGVKQLRDEEITHVKEQLDGINWSNGVILENFKRLEQVDYNPVGHQVYLQNNYNVDAVRAKQPNGFCMNIRYNSIEVFDKPISVTNINSSINKIWKRLTIRYKIDKLNDFDIRDYFISSLKKN